MLIYLHVYIYIFVSNIYVLDTHVGGRLPPPSLKIALISGLHMRGCLFSVVAEVWQGGSLKGSLDEFCSFCKIAAGSQGHPGRLLGASGQVPRRYGDRRACAWRGEDFGRLADHHKPAGIYLHCSLTQLQLGRVHTLLLHV